MGWQRKWPGLALVGAISLVSVRSAAQPQVEMANRSFETGADPGSMTAVAPGNTTIEGWTVVGGSVWYVGSKWKAFQGTRSVALPCGTSITQIIPTEPDQKYEVRFNMAGDPAAPQGMKEVTVAFGEERRAFSVDTTGRSAEDMGWAARFWVFEAADTKTTVSISSGKTNCSTPAIDNVRITPVEIGV